MSVRRNLHGLLSAAPSRLLFLSLGMVVYFADHLVHSIQIDAINRRVERNTRRAIAHEDTATVEEAAPQVPECFLW